MRAYNRGSSPEGIVMEYPAVMLADTYDVIAYYLRHQAEVDAYIRERESKAAEVRQQVEARHPEMVGMREKLQARIQNIMLLNQ